MKLSHYVRLCKIDTEGFADCPPELPQWTIRLLPKSEYGAWILMIHCGHYVIELATGEGN